MLQRHTVNEIICGGDHFLICAEMNMSRITLCIIQYNPSYWQVQNLLKWDKPLCKISFRVIILPELYSG